MPSIPGFSRVMRAKMHNRQGPGVLQEYRDIAKLLKRQSVAPAAGAAVSGANDKGAGVLIGGVAGMAACGARPAADKACWMASVAAAGPLFSQGANEASNRCR